MNGRVRRDGISIPNFVGFDNYSGITSSALPGPDSFVETPNLSYFPGDTVVCAG